MIDLHAHVLPGIDDGPATLEDSLELLELAARQGTKVIAATPHLRSDHPGVRAEELARRCAEVRAAIPPGWDIRVVVGAEVDLTWAAGATDEQLRLASFGQRGRDLLVETPFRRLAESFEDGLFALALRGYRTLLAHPELNESLQRRPERLTALVRRGVLLQVGAASLLDDGRPRARDLARRLVASGGAHVLASDAHSAGPWRPPRLAAGTRAALALNAARATWMVTAAPAAILVGKPLPPIPAAQPRGGDRKILGKPKIS